MTADRQRRDVWVTGICLVSSIARNGDEHWTRLQSPIAPTVVELRKTGLAVHPLPPIDYSTEIPNPLDRKRMGPRQALGVYTAGQALKSAALKDQAAILAKAAVIVVGTGGERDIALDEVILSEPQTFASTAALNTKLMSRMRPSLFLTQLPNLMACNISIQFGITGASRTTMGDELAGATGLKMGYELTADGTYDVALVGGAFNAERLDLALLYGFGRYLWPHDFQPVGERSGREGGCILGTMSAFLVLESAQHAIARGAGPYCIITGVSHQCSRRNKSDVAVAIRHLWNVLGVHRKDVPTGIISGATGVAPATDEELDELTLLMNELGGAHIRSSGSVVGHGMEVSFIFNVGLAALAVRNGRIYPPFPGESAASSCTDKISQMFVTSVGHWRGEAAALLSAVE
jgi:3-oxoacyl-[acyl-carrier-protein] synthase II